MTTAAAARYCETTMHATPQGAVIEVRGVLDWSSATSLLDQVTASSGRRHLLLDLSDTTRIDSAGTGALIAAFLHERRAGSRLAIVAGEEIAGLLREVGLADVVPVLTSPEAGRAWLSGT